MLLNRSFFIIYLILATIKGIRAINRPNGLEKTNNKREVKTSKGFIKNNWKIKKMIIVIPKIIKSKSAFIAQIKASNRIRKNIKSKNNIIKKREL